MDFRRRTSTFEHYDLEQHIVGAAVMENGVEITLEKPMPTLSSNPKMRVLCLHGFGQSADFFRMKLRRITQHIEENLDPDLLSRYPEGIEYFFPEGPIQLTTETQHESPQDIDMRAWWTKLEFTIRLDQLYSSLDYLTKYTREHGPFDGIIGFSQGASISMMLASLCEGSVRPERMEALANQGLPLLIPPPQEPFKFAIACCGFKNAPQFYDGFFTPKISTPTIHVVATWDHMVSTEQSKALIASCQDPVVIHHPGTHAVPTDRNSMREMSNFLNNACIRALLAEKPRQGSVTYTLQASELEFNEDTVTITAVTKLALSQCSTPSMTDGSASASSSSRSDSPGSEISSTTGAPRRRRLRFARRITVRRL